MPENLRGDFFDARCRLRVAGVAGVLRTTGEVEHQLTSAARPLRALSRAIPHSATPQSIAGARFYHRPLRVRLSPVRTGTLLFKTPTPGDYLCTNGNRTRDQRCTGVLLDVQLRQRRLWTPF